MNTTTMTPLMDSATLVLLLGYVSCSSHFLQRQLVHVLSPWPVIFLFAHVSPNPACYRRPDYRNLFADTFVAIHFGQAILSRKWFFIPTMVTGGIGEIIGWSGRLWSSHNPNSFDAFVIQICTTIFSYVAQALIRVSSCFIQS